MITTGAIVHVVQTGDTLWVVQRVWPDQRARLISKSVDDEGRETYHGRTAGLGDAVLVEQEPSYKPGEEIERGGVTYTVESDLGAEVVLVVPDTTFNHSTKTRLRVPGGNTVTAHKSDLVLETI